MSLRTAIATELTVLDSAGTRPVDVHAHTGADIDGTRRSAVEQIAELDAIGGRSVVFPFCVADGYEKENRRVLEECRRAPDRLVPFARLDPRLEAVSAEASAALAAGARGIKLHPRAEGFRLDHPGVQSIVAIAAEAEVPVLIHAGLGVGSFGRTVLTLAERNPACPLILAHAGVSDLCWLWEEVDSHPNLFFDTSWWNAADLIALFSLVPPGRILFGSDAPYMSREAVLAITLRCARFAGLAPEAVGLVAGGQLDRLLAGVAPIDAGPPPGPPREAPSPSANRVLTALTAAGGAKLGGGDPTQMAELARLALGDGSALGSSGPIVADLIEEGLAAGEQAPWALAMALALLLTPGVDAGVISA